MADGNNASVSRIINKKDETLLSAPFIFDEDCGKSTYGKPNVDEHAGLGGSSAVRTTSPNSQSDNLASRRAGSSKYCVGIREQSAAVNSKEIENDKGTNLCTNNARKVVSSYGASFSTRLDVAIEGFCESYPYKSGEAADGASNTDGEGPAIDVTSLIKRKKKRKDGSSSDDEEMCGNYAEVDPRAFLEGAESIIAEDGTGAAALETRTMPPAFMSCQYALDFDSADTVNRLPGDTVNRLPGDTVNRLRADTVNRLRADTVNRLRAEEELMSNEDLNMLVNTLSQQLSCAEGPHTMAEGIYRALESPPTAVLREHDMRVAENDQFSPNLPGLPNFLEDSQIVVHSHNLAHWRSLFLALAYSHPSTLHSFVSSQIVPARPPSAPYVPPPRSDDDWYVHPSPCERNDAASLGPSAALRNVATAATRRPPSEGRYKQIARGKSTREYLAYVQAIPKHQRQEGIDPQTPRVEGSSWREFQAEVRAWKRMLHRKYENLHDPGNGQTGAPRL